MWREWLKYPPEQLETEQPEQLETEDPEDLETEETELPLPWPAENLQLLSDYFQKQWMRRETLEDVSVWNHWKSGSHRTTNPAESFHAVLSRFVLMMYL